MTGLTIQPPPPCHVCGAIASANHVKGCGWLSCLRASAYPRVLDDNGIEWSQNLISKLQGENDALQHDIDRAQARNTELMGREERLHQACNYAIQNFDRLGFQDRAETVKTMMRQSEVSNG